MMKRIHRQYRSSVSSFPQSRTSTGMLRRSTKTRWRTSRGLWSRVEVNLIKRKLYLSRKWSTSSLHWRKSRTRSVIRILSSGIKRQSSHKKLSTSLQSLRVKSRCSTSSLRMKRNVLLSLNQSYKKVSRSSNKTLNYMQTSRITYKTSFLMPRTPSRNFRLWLISLSNKRTNNFLQN